MNRLDDLRAKYPWCGFALYALEPGGDVIFEIHDAGNVFTARGATAAEAIEAAFPAPVETPPAPAVDPFS